jgi:hypothetical protein
MDFALLGDTQLVPFIDWVEELGIGKMRDHAYF